MILEKLNKKVYPKKNIFILLDIGSRKDRWAKVGSTGAFVFFESEITVCDCKFLIYHSMLFSFVIYSVVSLYIFFDMFWFEHVIQLLLLYINGVLFWIQIDILILSTQLNRHILFIWSLYFDLDNPKQLWSNMNS